MSGITVFCAGAVKAALLAATSDFERLNGHRLDCTFGATGALQGKVAQGEPAGLVILNRSSVDALSQLGKIREGSMAEVGRVGMGIAVKQGAQHPDVSSPASLRHALLAAKSVSFGDPANGDSSGIHFAKVLAELGIADALKAKQVHAAMGLAVAEHVRNGKAELGATQASVILSTPGIELAGLLPDDLQSTTIYSLAVVQGPQAPAAGELAAFLGTPEARAIFAAAGFRQA